MITPPCAPISYAHCLFFAHKPENEIMPGLMIRYINWFWDTEKSAFISDTKGYLRQMLRDYLRPDKEVIKWFKLSDSSLRRIAINIKNCHAQTRLNLEKKNDTTLIHSKMFVNQNFRSKFRKVTNYLIWNCNIYLDEY